MTEAKRIGEALKAQRPDPVSGTIGERMLWGRLVRAIGSTLRNYTTRWSEDQWREAAGIPAEMDG